MYDKLYIAKQAASIAVSAVAQKLIKNAITNVTDMNDDDLAVIIASSIGGVYVSYKLSDTTDNLVELAAAKIETYRNRPTEAQQA
jgi:hypothetical protein